MHVLIFSFINRHHISPNILTKIQKLSQAKGNTETDILNYARDDINFLPDGRLRLEITPKNYQIYAPLLMKITQKNKSWYQPALELFVKDNPPLKNAVCEQILAKRTNDKVTLKSRHAVSSISHQYFSDENLDAVLLNNTFTSITFPTELKTKNELNKLAQFLNKPELEIYKSRSLFYGWEIAGRFFIFSFFQDSNKSF